VAASLLASLTSRASQDLPVPYTGRHSLPFGTPLDAQGYIPWTISIFTRTVVNDAVIATIFPFLFLPREKTSIAYISFVGYCQPPRTIHSFYQVISCQHALRPWLRVYLMLQVTQLILAMPPYGSAVELCHALFQRGLRSCQSRAPVRQVVKPHFHFGMQS